MDDTPPIDIIPTIDIIPIDTVPIAPVQLRLLPEPQVKARFRLSKSTRQRGLRHIAEIRQRLADRAA